MKLLPLITVGLAAFATLYPQAITAQNAPAWAQSVSGPAASCIVRAVTDASNYTFVVGDT